MPKILTRNEATRLYEAFNHPKAEHDSFLKNAMDEAFVNTNVYTNAQRIGKCIITGRKGSGKTALIMGQYYNNRKEYLCFNTVDADDLPFQTLYNFFINDFIEMSDKLKENFVSSDFDQFLDPVKVSNFAWKNAILTIALYSSAKQILENKEIYDISKDEKSTLSKSINVIENIIGSNKVEESDFGGYFWGLVVHYFFKIQNEIDSIINADNEKLSELLTKITNATHSLLKSKLGGDKNLSDGMQVLSSIMKRERKACLLGLDRFDDYYDHFYLQFKRDDIMLNKGAFLKMILEGLILAARDIKNNTDYSCLHLLITIPTDKFLQLGLRERADIETSHVIPLQWEPPELFSYVSKRIGYALQLPAHEWDNAWYDIFPRMVTNAGNLTTKEDSFLYLVRHSHWRPRDILFYIREILSRMIANGDALQASEATEEVFQEVAHEISQEIIVHEFIPEFDKEYPGIRKSLNDLEDKEDFETVMPYNSFCDSLGGIEPRNDTRTPDEVSRCLFQMGIIGVRKKLPAKNTVNKKKIKQDGIYVEYKYCYTTKTDDPFSSNVEVVFHPLFIDKLRIHHGQQYVIHQLTWDMFK